MEPGANVTGVVFEDELFCCMSDVAFDGEPVKVADDQLAAGLQQPLYFLFNERREQL